MGNETLLTLENASAYYGGVRALDGATIRVDEGEIIALMGPNGAGKSTALKSMFGLITLSKGCVLWHGKKIEPIPYEMPARGVAYVPQGRQVFKSLSVYENLELGGYVLANKKFLKENIDEVLKFFPALKERLQVKAGFLSGGQQQMLTIARGLVSDPKILLLDEPSLGLAPIVVKEVFQKIREINTSRKIAIIVVEHSIKSVLGIAHRVYVLSHGRVVAEKSAAEMKGSNELERIFLAA